MTNKEIEKGISKEWKWLWVAIIIGLLTLWFMNEVSCGRAEDPVTAHKDEYEEIETDWRGKNFKSVITYV